MAHTLKNPVLHVLTMFVICMRLKIIIVFISTHWLSKANKGNNITIFVYVSEMTCLLHFNTNIIILLQESLLFNYNYQFNFLFMCLEILIKILSYLCCTKNVTNKFWLVLFFFSFVFQINSKYSDELAQECLEWVREITGEAINVSGDMDNFYETLKDGVLLCKLVNTIKPSTVKRINESKMAFKCMENINGEI